MCPDETKLAQASERVAGLLAIVASRLVDPAFIAAHRVNPTAFTRRRCLGFAVVVALLLGGFRSGLTALLDEFFQQLTGTLERQVTKSALSQARYKLKASAFTALNEEVLVWAEAQQPAPRWHGWRVMAGDGTTLRLPCWPDTQATFGVQMQYDGYPFVLARAMGLYAPASGLMHRALLGPYATDERSLLIELLPSLKADDLLVLDRGFPAYWLLAYLQQQQVAYGVRMDRLGWPAVTAFLRSGQSQQTLTLPLSRDQRRPARQRAVPLTVTTLHLRLIRVLLPTGQVEVLATSLDDENRYPAADVADLYTQRWAIEEAFKHLKHRLCLEQFSGEHPEAIEQDVQAKLLTANLTNVLTQATQDSLPADYTRRFRPNLTYALTQLRLRLGLWLLKRLRPDDLLACLSLFARTREWHRPGRSSPRSTSPPRPKPRRQGCSTLAGSGTLSRSSYGFEQRCC